jgi:hypothetical protein
VSPPGTKEGVHTRLRVREWVQIRASGEKAYSVYSVAPTPQASQIFYNTVLYWAEPCLESCPGLLPVGVLLAKSAMSAFNVWRVCTLRPPTAASAKRPPTAVSSGRPRVGDVTTFWPSLATWKKIGINEKITWRTWRMRCSSEDINNSCYWDTGMF